jgi:protein-S-isoprenylcysteine O-methyltransferase Ste14
VVDKPTEDPLVAKAFDASKHEDLARAIEQLSPDEAQFFLTKLEAAIKKRKIQIAGYLVAMLVWLAGMLFALVWFGTHSGFVGWAFLLPFALVGGVLWAFGRWAERVSASTRKPPSTDVPGSQKT